MINISIVSYINTLPYKYALEKSSYINENANLIYSNPAKCAADLIEKRADIGLVPIGALHLLEKKDIITDFCLAANEKVDSVLLLSDLPLNEIKNVYLDYQSMTSVQLVKILAKNLWRTNFNFINAKAGYENNIKDDTAGVVIGDRALEMKSSYKYSYDLASEWKMLTGLPMVFAVWVSTGKADNIFIEKFSEILNDGVKNISLVIAENKSNYKSFELENYLTNCINFRLGKKERLSIQEFDRLLKKL